jgi:serine phosphatase RsbU (regulator of sigma subunit)
MSHYYSIDLENRVGSLEADSLKELQEQYKDYCVELGEVQEIDAINRIGKDERLVARVDSRKWEIDAELKVLVDQQADKMLVLIQEERESDYLDSIRIN